MRWKSMSAMGGGTAMATQVDDTREASSETTTARPTRLTLEQVLADAEAGVFDDRFDAFVPLELYGPPTAAELAAERRRARRRAAAARARVANGHAKPASA